MFYNKNIRIPRIQKFIRILSRRACFIARSISTGIRSRLPVLNIPLLHDALHSVLRTRPGLTANASSLRTLSSRHTDALGWSGHWSWNSVLLKSSVTVTEWTQARRFVHHVVWDGVIMEGMGRISLTIGAVSNEGGYNRIRSVSHQEKNGANYRPREKRAKPPNRSISSCVCVRTRPCRRWC